MASINTIGVILGNYPDSFIVDQSLERMIRSRPLVDMVVTYRYGAPHWKAEQFKEVPAYWGSIPEVVKLMHSAPVSKETSAYFHQPGLILHSMRIGSNGATESAIDILPNSRRVLDLALSLPRFDPSSNHLLGVWDTEVERFMSDRYVVQSTPVQFERAQKYGLNATTVHPRHPAQINKLSLREDVAERIRNDLWEGFAVVLPGNASQDVSDPTTWWRVHPNTGETLGMLSDGSGGAIALFPFSASMTEFLVTSAISFGVSGAFAAGGYRDCMVRNNNSSCCGTAAVSFAVIGGVIGFAAQSYMLWEISIKGLLYLELATNTGMAAFSTFGIPDLCE